VIVNPDARVTAKEAQAQLGVSLSLICMWVSQGKLQVKAYRDRRGTVIPAEDVDQPDRSWSKLYRWGDLYRVERDTRRNDPAGQRRARAA
jgi:predicted site-specific integrase-resolvase